MNELPEENRRRRVRTINTATLLLMGVLAFGSPIYNTVSRIVSSTRDEIERILPEMRKEETSDGETGNNSAEARINRERFITDQARSLAYSINANINRNQSSWEKNRKIEFPFSNKERVAELLKYGNPQETLDEIAGEATTLLKTREEGQHALITITLRVKKGGLHIDVTVYNLAHPPENMTPSI